MFWQQGTRNLKSIHFYELFLNIEGDLSLFALSLLIWGMSVRNGPLVNVTGGPGQRLMTSAGDPRSRHWFPGCPRQRRRKTGGCGTTTQTTRTAGDRLRPGANAIIFSSEFDKSWTFLLHALDAFSTPDPHLEWTNN